MFTKPGIFEIDLHQSDIRNQLPWMDALFQYSKTFIALLKEFGFSDLAESDNDNSRLNCCQSDSHIDPNILTCLYYFRRTIKLQYNNGTGGCFPAHYDNPGPGSNRAITCILYLNKDWCDRYGGEITLYPFLGEVSSKLSSRAFEFIINEATYLHQYH